MCKKLNAGSVLASLVYKGQKWFKEAGLDEGEQRVAPIYNAGRLKQPSHRWDIGS